MSGLHSPFTIIHIPHASKVVPEEVSEQFVLNDQDLADELRLMTDAYTDELFEIPETLARTVAYPVSRLVVDPERFVDDNLEIMVQKGMGVVSIAAMPNAFGRSCSRLTDARRTIIA
ncbi:MAG: N-formylglutamate amidohydrolase [Pirellulaceae bacterium]|nr:N-formylglutamate amidohydrolase [Pirellulaceae bacterium]